MFLKRKYKYIIFFWNVEQVKNGFGFGITEIVRNRKIKGVNDLVAINEKLTEELKQNCSVINYKRI